MLLWRTLLLKYPGNIAHTSDSFLLFPWLNFLRAETLYSLIILISLFFYLDNNYFSRIFISVSSFLPIQFWLVYSERFWWKMFVWGKSYLKRPCVLPWCFNALPVSHGLFYISINALRQIISAWKISFYPLLIPKLPWSGLKLPLKIAYDCQKCRFFARSLPDVWYTTTLKLHFPVFYPDIILGY